MTFSKLSARNAKRQARDYLVYFVTIVMAAALIYAFNGLVFSEEIRNLSHFLDSLPLIIVLASTVIICIVGWLVSYTTRFMLTKRSRELGTYVLLGMENKQVARLFFQENLMVGGIAIVCGTLLGNLLFQALRAVTLALFHVPYTFSFSFSIGAVLLTAAYFALIYLFALRRSLRRINRMKIYDLLYLDRQNENEAVKKSGRRRILFVVSIILGIIGTVLLLLRNLMLGIIGAALIIAFLYGFFLSFSSGVPDYFDKRPAKKFAGNNLLIFRSLASKLTTMGVIMATIAVLFTATLIAEGTGMVFNALFQSRTEQTTCFDIYIASNGWEEASLDDYMAYIDENIDVRADYRYGVYAADNDTVTQYVEANSDYWRNFEFDTLMAMSDYLALREMLGYSTVEVLDGQYIIHCQPYLEGLMSSYNKPLTVDGYEMAPGKVYTEHFTQSLWDGNGRGFILVVPNEALTTRPVIHRTYAAMTETPLSEATATAISDIRDAKDKSIAGYDTVFIKAAIQAENASMYAMIIFPLFYLALVLTMVAVTILTIQLLSDTDRYQRQYALLDNLGMERREMERSLFRQFAIFYAMPTLPSLLISLPFIFALGSALDAGVLTGIGQLWAIVGITLTLFFAIYIVYVFAAYTSYRKNVLPSR
ncbi:ABC transporter permease [Ohessyouella blattaphilus]|uniref:ABC transporter permease n=1 Tax=Ohessyouella blattaphilus TaxID=2949333 RepID=A0ABT1EGA4_9FIRM|nr:ABC transporter permease [Ohessyouella blattaphilus]MCP1109736.1 ABC transporter permease [Ohessyouella blattaphilus]MCR8563130.1 ABC transporter permease [Ohessyouella blattaphilus]